jgi:hypothetical protein
MSWWNTTRTWTHGNGEYEFSCTDGVSGDLPWDFASDWIDAYVRRFDRAPKRSEVMGAFEAMFESRARSCKILGEPITHTGWCDEDHPVEMLDE